MSFIRRVGLIKFIAENLQSEHSLRRPSLAAASDQSRGADRVALPAGREAPGNPDRPVDGNSSRPGFWYVPNTMSKIGSTSEIGRASCRERVESTGVGVAVKKKEE